LAGNAHVALQILLDLKRAVSGRRRISRPGTTIDLMATRAALPAEFCATGLATDVAYHSE
jgi:hypothetical protein